MAATSSGKEEICVVHIDDDKEILHVTGEFLEREDDRITTHTAQTAAKGIELIERHDIDCIISDYKMEKTDGLELLNQIQESWKGFLSFSIRKQRGEKFRVVYFQLATLCMFKRK